MLNGWGLEQAGLQGLALGSLGPNALSQGQQDMEAAQRAAMSQLTPPAGRIWSGTASPART